MVARVFLSDDMSNFPKADIIATGLALFHDKGKYPDFLGHYGRFERNQQALNSQLHKIHIAFSNRDSDLPTWQNKRGSARTCDNFVIYVQHFFEDECFQLLGVVTPDAHNKIDKLLPYFIEKAEKFHKLTKMQLSSMPFFDSTNLKIMKEIRLTD